MAHQVPDSWGARRRQVGELDLLHQRPESLGQRGVNADGPLEQRESAGQHHGVEDLHQLATLCAQDGRPQDVVGFSAPWFVGLRISACGLRLAACGLADLASQLLYKRLLTPAVLKASFLHRSTASRALLLLTQVRERPG